MSDVSKYGLSVSPFERALAEARLNKRPVIALRPDHRDPKLMDDVVISYPQSLHMEMMSDDVLWIGVQLVNGDHIAFNAYARKRGCLEFRVFEHPSGDYEDWDDLFHRHRQTPLSGQSER